MSVRRTRIALAVALAAMAFVAAAVAPVWTYAVSLAVFGLPHVGCELRYLDERFGARVDRATWRRLAGALLAIAGLRALAVLGVGDFALRAAVELLLGGALVAALAPCLGPATALPRALAFATVALALAGASLAPAAALVTFAFLHNLTPLGLLAERLRGPARAPGLALAALGFVAAPALLVVGGRAAIVAALGLPRHDDGPAALGDLAAASPSFVPGPWLDAPWSGDLFAAAAFLQCLHYLVVIGWLPRLGSGDAPAAPKLRWPQPRAFAGLVLAGTALLAVGYLADFAGARTAYGVVASVHAWIEVPILLLAAAGLRASHPPAAPDRLQPA